MSGVKISQAFNMDEVLRDIDDFVMDKEEQTVIAFSYIGEQIVTAAKQNHEFTTQTGQLEASIGYQVTQNGSVIFEQADGEAKGVEAAKALFQTVATKDGVSLVIVAGKEYAAAVEARGYDVISNSIPSESEILKQLKELLDE